MNAGVTRSLSPNHRGIMSVSPSPIMATRPMPLGSRLSIDARMGFMGNRLDDLFILSWPANAGHPGDIPLFAKTSRAYQPRANRARHIGRARLACEDTPP